MTFDHQKLVIGNEWFVGVNTQFRFFHMSDAVVFEGNLRQLNTLLDT